MDPISVIITALVLGAAEGLKPTAERAVKDAYSGLRELIKRKYNKVNLELLENGPASEYRKKVVREDIANYGADTDNEVLKQSYAVIKAIEQYAPATAEHVGVKLTKIKADRIKIEDITSPGAGIIIEDATVGGDIIIKGVQVGGERGEDSAKK